MDSRNTKISSGNCSLVLVYRFSIERIKTYRFRKEKYGNLAYKVGLLGYKQDSRLTIHPTFPNFYPYSASPRFYITCAKDVLAINGLYALELCFPSNFSTVQSSENTHSLPIYTFLKPTL